jgi:hypothetical protein
MIEKILTYLGVLGIGGVLGIIIKFYFDSKVSHNKLLFEARSKAYFGLMGRMLNLFCEVDLNTLPEPIRVSKINHLLSEVFLLGSKKLVELAGEYQILLFKYHEELHEVTKNKKKDETKLAELHAALIKLSIPINEQMRKDLNIKT